MPATEQGVATMTLHQINVTPRNRGTLSEALKACDAILKELSSKKYSSCAWPFYSPVDAEALALHDYHDIIKRPMDLGTVKTKLDNREYKSAAEFADDVRLIFRNCYRYNPADQYIVALGQKLQGVFEMRFAKIPDEQLKPMHSLDDDSSDDGAESNSNDDQLSKIEAFEAKLSKLQKKFQKLKNEHEQSIKRKAKKMAKDKKKKAKDKNEKAKDKKRATNPVDTPMLLDVPTSQLPTSCAPISQNAKAKVATEAAKTRSPMAGMQAKAVNSAPKVNVGQGPPNVRGKAVSGKFYFFLYKKNDF